MPNTNDDIILYYDSRDSTKNITVKKYNELVSSSKKEELADFIYNRLYSRYIKPFKFDNVEYKKEYKNAFSMMASFCLLIETLQSFKEGLGDSIRKSTNLFKNFFTNTNLFTEFENQGEMIYTNIRCGILHQGETTGGWKITRKDKVSSSFSTKTINANEFMDDLEKSLKEYKDKLISENWDSTIWENFRIKMGEIIKNTRG